jgi:hypothetical protein
MSALQEGELLYGLEADLGAQLSPRNPELKVRTPSRTWEYGGRCDSYCKGTTSDDAYAGGFQAARMCAECDSSRGGMRKAPRAAHPQPC